MEGFIGKLDWVATEIATGAQTSDVLELRCEDVKVDPVTSDPLRRARVLRRVVEKISAADPTREQKIAEGMKRIAALESPERPPDLSHWKRIRLSPDYGFTYSEDFSSNETGFGLGAARIGVPTFSFEFFVVSSPGKAYTLPSHG